MLLAVTGAVLAGGLSRRMGRPKAFLSLGGRTLLARQVDLLGRIFERVLVAASDPGPFLGLGFEVVCDRRPDRSQPATGGGRPRQPSDAVTIPQGPIAGIAAAIAAARTEHVFCCGVDMPFLSEPLVRHMAALAPGFDVVVPRALSLRAESRRPGACAFEPLCAVYGQGALGRLDELLRTGPLRIEAAFETLRVRVLEPAEIERFDPMRSSFRNINTPEEFEKVRREVEGANVPFAERGNPTAPRANGGEP